MGDFFSLRTLFRRALTLCGVCFVATVLTACGRTSLDEPAASSSPGAAPSRPESVAPSRVLSGADLPDTPSDRDFALRPLFAERLIPLGGATTPEENRALATAIRAAYTHRERMHTDELDAFLREHPRSPWRASLLTNLGIIWRQTARYSDALRAWEEAWSLAKSETSWLGRATADRAVSELAYLNAQLGRQQRLRELFAELAVRPPSGTAAQRTTLAQMGLASMEVHPERSFRCGPLSLASVWLTLRPNEAVPAAVDATPSTTQGTSFTQLLALAQRIGMPLRAVRRRAGSDFVVPSVIHWRLDHFAAIVATETSPVGDRTYVIWDPTFGRSVRTSDRWLDQETSGNVLIPADRSIPDGWEELSDEAAAQVWGRGQTTGSDPDAFGDRDLIAQCGNSRGMARHGFHAHVAALHVEDTPIWLNPAFGPAVDFKVAYNQAEFDQSQTPWTSSLGARWTHNWESYLEYRPSSPQRWVRRIGGGGIAIHLRDADDNAVRTARERHGGMVGEVRSIAIPLPPVTNIEVRAEDGSVEIYERMAEGVDAARWYLRRRVDPQGNQATVNYEQPSLRITSITSADGAALTLHYRNNEDPLNSEYYLISRVTDSYGREANFDYAASGSNPWMRLERIRDIGNVASKFEYHQVDRGRMLDAGTPPPSVPDPDFLHELRTPYGTTRFVTGWDQVGPTGTFAGRYIQRWVESRQYDRSGARIAGERVEFREIVAPVDDCAGMRPCGYGSRQEFVTTGVRDALVAHGGNHGGPITYLNNRNTYYWNTIGYERGRSTPDVTNTSATFDPRHAHVYHWVHDADSSARVAPILESELPPGEHRIQYVYAGQPNAMFLPVVPGNERTYVARPILRSRVRLDQTNNPSQGPLAGEDWSTAYTPSGRVQETRDPAGRQRCYSYNAAPDEDLVAVHAQPCPRGSGGELLQIDPAQTANRLLRIQYHPGGKHLPSHTTGPDGQVTQWLYNAAGQVIRATRADGRWIDYHYNGSTSSVFPAGASVPGYDTLDAVRTGRLARVRFPGGTADAGTDAVRESRITYHPDGTVQSVVDADGVERAFVFDSLERITEISSPIASPQQTTTFSYAIRDEAGNVYPETGFEPTTITLPGGQTLTRAYDALHRLIRSTNGGQDVVRYRYNRANDGRFDLVQKLRDSSEDLFVAWSAPLTSVPPDNGMTPSGVTGYDTSFQQAVQRRVRFAPAPAEVDATWEFDHLGRVQRAREGSDEAVVVRRDDGRIERVCEGSAACPTGSNRTRHEFQYEPGHLQQLTTISWFDNAATPAAHVRTTTHHPLGGLGALQPWTVEESWRALGRTVTYSYDALGRVRRAQTPSDDLNIAFDDFDRLSTVHGGSDGGVQLARMNYSELNRAARPVEVFETVHQCRRSLVYHDAVHDFRLGTEYRYDNGSNVVTAQGRTYEAGRLFSELFDAPQVGFTGKQHYYDTAGQLQSSYDWSFGGWHYFLTSPHGGTWFHGIELGGNWAAWSFHSGDTHDRIVQRTVAVGSNWFNWTVISDSRGRTTNDGEYEYTWNQRDELTRVRLLSTAQTWDFRYDGDGRLRRFQDGTHWRHLVWVGGELLEEYRSDTEEGTRTQTRSFHIDGVTEHNGAAQQRYLYERDARGSILRLIRAGQVVRSWGYDPQGNRVDLGGTEAVGSRLGFAGYVTHADTGLMFTPHRVYSARLRQWLSRDPLGDRDSIDGNNLYAYAANDPVNYTDPSGLNPVGLIYAIEQRAVQYANDSIGALGTNCQPDPGAYVSGLAYDMVFGAATAAVFGMVSNIRPRRTVATPTFSNLGDSSSGRYAGNLRRNGSTYSLRGSSTPLDGRFDFVVQNGQTRLGRSHFFLASGNPVTYAGEAHFADGALTSWSNASGHYRPSAAFAGNAGLPMDSFRAAHFPTMVGGPQLPVFR